MKTLLISLMAFMFASVLRSSRFNFLDITSDNYEISWDEITDDLWP